MNNNYSQVFNKTCVKEKLLLIINYHENGNIYIYIFMTLLIGYDTPVATYYIAIQFLGKWDFFFF